MNRRDFRLLALYEFKLGHKASEAAQSLQKTFGNNAPKERTVREWFAKFRSGDLDIEDAPRSGRPSSPIDDQLKEMVETNPKRTCADLAEELGVSSRTVWSHLIAMGKTKKLDQWVPHELTDHQMNTRIEVCSSLLLRNQNDPFLDRIFTCDEKWILYDNRKRSRQWLDKNEPPRSMPKANLHPKKTMITVWWSAAGLLHYSFLRPGAMITAESYCRELDVVHQKLQLKHPALVNRRGPILLHDNARPHVARMTHQKLFQLGIETLPHPPYSPDLSPTDFHFFRALDLFLKEKRFRQQDDVENTFQQFIDSRALNFYKKGINALVSRWQKCVEQNGAYFK